jgi:hypothetical protein
LALPAIAMPQPGSVSRERTLAKQQLGNLARCIAPVMRLGCLYAEVALLRSIMVNVPQQEARVRYVP